MKYQNSSLSFKVQVSRKLAMEDDVIVQGDLVFICIDESSNSARAFEWFYEHHYREEHTVGLVHVETDTNKNEDGRESSDVREPFSVMKKSTAVIQKYLQKCSLSGMKVKLFTKIKNGTIGGTVCELIDEHKPDLVIIGQRGLGAIQRTIYGSVSEYLLHHSHSPVLVIPPLKAHRKLFRRQTVA